jgi:hypothetical protein
LKRESSFGLMKKVTATKEKIRKQISGNFKNICSADESKSKVAVENLFKNYKKRRS